MISICIPLYKSSFLKETLTSLNHQDFKNIEVILVNDGDGRDYSEIIAGFPSLNLKYLIQKNEGAGAARNKAFRHSTGQYIKFLDADDVLSVNHLSEQLKLALKYPAAIVSGKWGRFYNNDLHTFRLEEESIYKNCEGKEWITESWLQGPNMTQPGIFLIPRKLIEEHGLWQPELSKGPCDDMEFFTRMILNSNGIVFCKGAILYYRSGNENNLSGLKSIESFEWFLETIKRSSEHLLLKSLNHLEAKKAAATQFKLLGYKAYPYHKDVSRKAMEEAKRLADSSYPYPAGGVTQILNQLFGWRMVIELKKILGYKKIN